MASVPLKRETSIDSIKFVLIAIVVLGHTFQLNMDEGINANLFAFCNSFHMPSFILLSGFFYRDTDSKKFWRNIFELLLVILIFQIIYFSWEWLDPLDFSLKGIWYRVSHIYFPRRALWYILSLCFWRIIMRYYPKQIRENYKITIPIALGISLLAGFVPISAQFAFQKTFAFFPFFLIGYYIHKYGYWSIIRGFNKWVCGVIIVGYFIVLIIIKNFPVLLCTEHLHFFTFGSWKSTLFMFGIRALSYLWMLPLTICVLNVIPDCRFFAEQGKNTMFYFLYHPFFIWLMNLFVTKYNAPTSSLFLLLYTIISVFIMYLLSKIPVLNYFTKPITTLKRKK